MTASKIFYWTVPVMLLLACLIQSANFSDVANKSTEGACPSPTFDGELVGPVNDSITTYLPNGHIIYNFTDPYTDTLKISDFGKTSYVWPTAFSKFRNISLSIGTPCLDASKFSNIPTSNLYSLIILPVFGWFEEDYKIIGLADNLYVFQSNYTKIISIQEAYEPQLLSVNFPELFPNLESLSLIGSNITNLLVDSNSSRFSHMSQIKTIYLDKNLIEEIPSNTFSFDHLVSFVGLWENPIRKIERSAFSNVSFVEISLGNTAKIDMLNLEGITNRTVLYFDKSAVSVVLYISSKHYIAENRFILPEIEFVGSRREWKYERYAEEHKLICPRIPTDICKFAEKVFFTRLCLKNVDDALALGSKFGYGTDFDVCSNQTILY